MLYLTDVVLRSSDDKYEVPDGAGLLIAISVNGAEISRTKQLTETSQSLWTQQENIYIPDNERICTLKVMLESSWGNHKLLGYVDVIGEDLLTRALEHAGRTRINVINTQGGAQFELDCVLVAREPAISTSDTEATLSASTSGPFKESRCSLDQDYEDTQRLSDDDPQKQTSLVHVGTLFYQRYRLLNYPAALINANEALHAGFKLLNGTHTIADQVPILRHQLETWREAMSLMDQTVPDLIPALSTYGSTYIRLFRQSGNVEDLTKAVSAFDYALSLSPASPLIKAELLSSMGNAFRSRHNHSADIRDLDRSISAIEEAVRLTSEGHAELPARLSSLGNSRLERFEHGGATEDLTKAVYEQQRAVDLAPENLVYLSNLAKSRALRFERNRDLSDLEYAISAFSKICARIPDGVLLKPAFSHNLATAYLTRFGLRHDLEDVDKAVAAFHDAESFRFAALGVSTFRRHDFSRDRRDVDWAISSLKEAVSLSPSDRVSLYNLGLACHSRFQLMKSRTDIDNAIAVLEDSLRLTPSDHADKMSHLGGLGLALSTRFQGYDDIRDIDRAISLQADIVSSTEEKHPQRPSRLSNLAVAYRRRFTRSGDMQDMDKAISAAEEAVRLTPDGVSQKLPMLENLAKMLITRNEHTRRAADIQEAVSHVVCAATATVGSPSVRFASACLWAQLVRLDRDDSAALRGYAVALDILPRLAWLGQTVLQRHERLVEIGTTANEAAAVATALGEHALAIQWLDQARGIVWGQLFHLRTSLGALRHESPDVANELERVSRALDDAGTRELAMAEDLVAQISAEEVAQQQHRLAEEWEALLSKARKLPDFEDFLLPKTFTRIAQTLPCSPVAVINADVIRCDALVYMKGCDNPIHIPLFSFSLVDAQRLQGSLRTALSDPRFRLRNDRAAHMIAVGAIEMTIEEILRELWTSIVKPILDALAFPVSDAEDPPRIWWCPTGPLAFLPLHAAGIYTTNELGNKVSDYVVSSYTPTLTALIERSRISPKFHGMLSVSQSKSAGLPNSKVEVDKIKEIARNAGITSQTLEESDATVVEVTEGLERYSWVHLACHGIQNTVEPTKSAFSLHNGSLMLSKIISVLSEHADFAFLSACQTATGSEKLPEEAAHLAAGMLAAGYRSVIATMWSILDSDAPVVAEEVYRRLLHPGSKPDSTQAAYALHHAVKRLRENHEKSGKDTFSWVPFIHVGV